MRTISGDLEDAIEAGEASARNFIWFEARDRSDDSIKNLGVWNDSGLVEQVVIDGFTGLPATRDFQGSGRLVKVEDIPLTSDLTIRQIRVHVNPLTAEINTLLRGYDIKGHPIQVYRGYLDPDTNLIIEPPTPRFVGFVDQVFLPRPKKGGTVAGQLICRSKAQELTRTNTETRSDQSLKARTAGADRYYQYTDAVGSWQLFWGQEQGTPAVVKERPKVNFL